MRSPFPGMNPYLEQAGAWRDFHGRFLPRIAERITAQVRPAYFVRIEEDLYIHERSAEERRLPGRADVALAPSTSAPSSLPSSPVLTAPIFAHLEPAVEIERQNFLEIRDQHTRSVITVIELLSPTNKRHGPDREQYLAKRRRLLAGTVHFVELDLLRGGSRMPPDDLPDCDYYALVSRVEDRPRVGVWPLRLRERLPEIPIPLRTPDPDARIDLQSDFQHVFDAAGYEDYIYSGAPEPPLHPDDAAWARQFVPNGR
jgi:hypothetical protein